MSSSRHTFAARSCFPSRLLPHIGVDFVLLINRGMSISCLVLAHSHLRNFYSSSDPNFFVQSFITPHQQMFPLLSAFVTSFRSVVTGSRSITAVFTCVRVEVHISKSEAELPHVSVTPLRAHVAVQLVRPSFVFRSYRNLEPLRPWTGILIAMDNWPTLASGRGRDPFRPVSQQYVLPSPERGAGDALVLIFCGRFERSCARFTAASRPRRLHRPYHG